MESRLFNLYSRDAGHIVEVSLSLSSLQRDVSLPEKTCWPYLCSLDA